MNKTNNTIPSDVIRYNLVNNLDIQSITSLGRTNKDYYKKIIADFKGLWDRTLDFSMKELKLNPLLPLLKTMDGLNKNNYINQLFSENIKLFNNKYNSSNFTRSSYPYRLLTLNTYNNPIDLSPQEQIAANKFITDNLSNLGTLERDIENVKKIIALFDSKSLKAAVIEGLIYPMLFIIPIFSWNHSCIKLISSLLSLAVYYILAMDYKAKLYREADEINKSKQMEGIDIKNINEKTLQYVIDTNFYRSQLVSKILVIFMALVQAYLYL